MGGARGEGASSVFEAVVVSRAHGAMALSSVDKSRAAARVSSRAMGEVRLFFVEVLTAQRIRMALSGCT
jgi:hypothetical protein